ncbi:MAG: hypothetical protein ACOC05_06825 [Oceanicaulis sp.]
MMKTLVLAAAAAAFAPIACAKAQDAAEPQAVPGAEASPILTVLTAAEPQTQLMALILTRFSAQAGADVRVLLCDAAGDLALAEPPESATTPLAPRGMSPHGLLSGLMEAGVTVQVCAIYLPNSDHTEADLMDGVGVAAPPEIAAVMVEPNTKLFTF